MKPVYVVLFECILITSNYKTDLDTNGIYSLVESYLGNRGID